MNLRSSRRAHISLETVRKVNAEKYGKRDVRESCKIAYRNLCNRVKNA